MDSASKPNTKDSNSDSKQPQDAVKNDRSGSTQTQSNDGSPQSASKGLLANTGANAVLPLAVLGSVALIAGAVILIRRRKA